MGLWRIWASGIVALLLTLPAGRAAEMPEIRVGMTAAFSGPVRMLGLSMRRGIEACFAEVNAKGGVRGRRLRLIALDDSYHPDTAAANMQRLIDLHDVIAIIGSVGTPTAGKTLPIARNEGILLFGALTGARLLRAEVPDRYVINFRASYKEETRAMIDGLLGAGFKPEDIAFFTQDDGFGQDGYEGALEALAAHGFSGGDRLPHGRYPRNTRNVEPALAALLESPRPPRAVIMVAAYAPAAKFIRLARQIFPDTLFLNLSFVGSEALHAALGPAGEGVIVTEVVPLLSSPLPAVRDFHAAFARSAPGVKPNMVALEGYLAARVFVRGLAAAGPDPDREAVIDGLLALGPFDIGLGKRLNLDPTDHQASHRVWPTIFRDGRSQPLDWRQLAP